MSGKFEPALQPGQDAVAIEFDPDDGSLTTTWSDGTTNTTPANDDLAVEIRATGFATHQFLKPQFRRYPVPRI